VKKLRIEKGLSAKALKQLLDFSRTDKVIRKYTTDPKRFKDEEAFKIWQKQGRIIYSLVDEKSNLRGIIWFGKKAIDAKEFPSVSKTDLEKYSFTFAIRLYENARGKGLAVPFMKAVFTDFGQKRVWLETGKDNLPALKTYKRFGFHALTENRERVLMVWDS
jgi:ribosomal protein S18 acetylase RimI-like enzyme